MCKTLRVEIGALNRQKFIAGLSIGLAIYLVLDFLHPVPRNKSAQRSPYQGHPLYPCERDSPKKGELEETAKKRRERECRVRLSRAPWTSLRRTSVLWPVAFLTYHDGLSEAGKVALLEECLLLKHEAQSLNS